MTFRTLNYGNYGIFLIMGNAGFCPSTVPPQLLLTLPPPLLLPLLPPQRLLPLQLLLLLLLLTLPAALTRISMASASSLTTLPALVATARKHSKGFPLQGFLNGFLKGSVWVYWFKTRFRAGGQALNPTWTPKVMSNNGLLYVLVVVVVVVVVVMVVVVMVVVVVQDPYTGFRV